MTKDEIFKRYLAILGVEAASPSLEHLNRLVRAQLTRVPFENVSKLLLKRTAGASYIPPLKQHLDGIEHHQFGGTCYANNPHFCQLLRYLDYEVDLCGAEMSRPDVHIVNIVRLEGREYLVDVGYGAPFYEPMPRDLDHPLEIPWGINRYVLHPKDERGRSRMDQWREGDLVHGYTVHPVPRELDHFRTVIHDSYRSSATFMNVLVIERFFADRSQRVHNFTFSESTRQKTVTKDLKNVEKLVATVSGQIGIHEEQLLVAIDGLSLAGEIYT